MSLQFFRRLAGAAEAKGGRAKERRQRFVFTLINGV